MSVTADSDFKTESSRRKAVLQDEWTAAWTYLQSQTVSVRFQRIKVILLLLKETGCRLQQLSSIRRRPAIYLSVSRSNENNRGTLVLSLYLY